MLQELIDIFDTKLQIILDLLDYDEEDNESNHLLYALRFEAETNRIWLEDTYTTLNYLRVDAWDNFRKDQNRVLYTPSTNGPIRDGLPEVVCY